MTTVRQPLMDMATAAAGMVVGDGTRREADPDAGRACDGARRPREHRAALQLRMPWDLGLHPMSPPCTDTSSSKEVFSTSLTSRWLRTAYFVGYELLAEAQRDLTPEDAAAHLRGVSATHYTTTRDR